MIAAHLVHNRQQMRVELVARDLLEPVPGGSMLHGTGTRPKVLGWLADEALNPEALVVWLASNPRVVIVPQEGEA